MVSDWSAVTAEELLGEVDRLRLSGLASVKMSDIREIVRLSAEAGFGSVDDMTVVSIRGFVTAAIGMLDNDALNTSAARLLGLAHDMALTATLADRTLAAAKQRGVSSHAYSGRPPKGGKSEDLRTIADQLVGLHREAVARHEAWERRQSGPSLPAELLSIVPPPAVALYLDGLTAADWLKRRQEQCARLWQELLAERDRQLDLLGPLSPKLCIFASGSYGRDEAMEYSDLDLFLVDDAPGKDKDRYGSLNKFELGLALTLIDRTRVARQIQRFSQGGYYQDTQSFRRMLVEGGGRKEGPSSLTTARALLLTNSKCLVNEELYEELRTKAMDDYWRGNKRRSGRPLRPSFLINDLRRMWLTMLVNFEHFYPKEKLSGRLESGTNRKIAGLKLSLPQQLGCYTPILTLLERCSDDGLDREAAEDVLAMTTSQRLDSLAKASDPIIAQAASTLRELYGQYLAYSWCNKEDMADRVSSNDWPAVKDHFNRAHELILQMLWVYNARIPRVARFALV